jgi:hypothetical protein
MTAVDTRHAQQREIEALLGEIDERRRRIYRLQAGGVLPAGMRELKRELRDVRGRLSDAIEGPVPEAAFARAA